jgi:L-asparagine transporter-like permease
MLKNTIVFSFVLIVAALLWNLFVPENIKSPATPYIVIYFFVSTVVTHQLLMKTNKQSPQNFIRAYLGTTALRLFLNLMVIIIYMLVNRSGAMVFALSFLVFYFLYLIFEIISLQKDLKEK